MYIYELGIFVSMTCNTYKICFYMFVHTCNMNAPVISVRICINIDDYICIMYIEDEVCELYIYINDDVMHCNTLQHTATHCNNLRPMSCHI